MRHIFVDLEMNGLSKKYKKSGLGCNSEIIEIGAVALDENYKEIGSYKRYVKPQYNETVEPRFIRLTGITYDMLENEEHYETVMDDFVEWCKEMGGEEFTMYSWSMSDLTQITKETNMKSYEGNDAYKYMVSHWDDYQKDFTDMLNLSNPISLEKAVTAIDKDFEGKQHDALCDARNTAIIFELSKDEKEFKKRMQPIVDLFAPKPALTSSLGAFFNFDFEAVND